MLRKQTNKQSFGMMVITLLMLLVAAACTPAGNEPGASSGEPDTALPTPEATVTPDMEASPEPNSGLPEALKDSKWDLISLNGELPVAGSQPTLDFNEDGLGGSAGCNSYFGSFTIVGDTLTISEVGSTLMACLENELMTQESTFLSMLQAAESFTLSDEQLIIHTTQGDLVFQPAQNQSLEGVSWVLNGLTQNDAIVSTWVDSEITATFAEGQVTGSAGCNQYFATYEISDTALTIGAIGATKMACEDEKNQRETEFLTAMASVAGYEIERDSLKLLDANGDTLLLFQAQKAS